MYIWCITVDPLFFARSFFLQVSWIVRLKPRANYLRSTQCWSLSRIPAFKKRLRGLNFCEAMDHWSNFDRGEPNETSPNRMKRGENHMNHQLCEQRLLVASSICIFPLTPGFHSDAVLGDGNEEEVSQQPASPLGFAVLGMNSFDLNEVLDFWFLENQMK